LFKYPRLVATGCLAGLTQTGGASLGLWGPMLLVLVGYLYDVYVFGAKLFYILMVAQGFFGSAVYTVVGPYMAEVWPARLRASGMGLSYGVGNCGKFIGPLGLALIMGGRRDQACRTQPRHARPGDQLLRRVVCPRGDRLLGVRVRTQGPLVRGDRRQTRHAGTGRLYGRSRLRQITIGSKAFHKAPSAMP
jgi:hypothetical protein